ncbi:ABC transporter substrate-binding protein [Microbacterium sp. XT11]|uniref:ABC transporter substrate-binding protein n=1 Tax=Microbacterium sp. XT11 TaxID=367477 RepID=UPI000742D241|nr:ABC transporter substrate-binding protein [Microbacterium sp. XT11]ALX65900.1 hypothetical protein AB663_000689 [Microbacterium sp. XT11]
MNRVRIAAFGAASLAAAITLAGCAQPEPAAGGGIAEDLDHITIQLDFQPRGNHAMFYVADKLGYFEEEGIAIDDILVGQSSGETLRLVGSGSGDIGVADLPTLALARSQGVKVKAIAAINQVSPLAMCTKKDVVDLKTVDDLRGLSVGVQASGSTYVFYQALLSLNGIDKSELTELTVKPPYENYLLSDQVDTVPCYLDAEFPLLAEHAGGEDKVSVLKGVDWGYEALGTGIFASDAYLKENPDVVERFLRAYVKAFEYTIENPEKAAQILADSSPQLAQNVDLYTTQLETDNDLTFESDTTDAEGLGAMSDEQWQTTIDLLVEQGVITDAPSVDDVRDSSFISAVNG